MPDNENPGSVPPLNPVPPPQTPAENQIRMWNMLCHLSALSGFIVPFGNILGPLLVWQIKKNEFPSVIEHGKAALNVQLTILIAVLVALFAGLVLIIIGIGILLIFGAMALHLVAVIFAIIAGVNANDGKPYKY